MKDEEKLERTIRGLSKLPENRRCINCNALGPQYVCTTFSTFVCQICSGIHREFTHRVKSISMAKFSQDEVNALQAGGNEKARMIFFKEYDPQRQPQPDSSSNMYRLRDFIKHVYVDGKYMGKTSLEQLPRLRLTIKKEELPESMKSLSPRSEGRNERHHSGMYSPSGRSEGSSYRYYYDERRSPRYPRESSRSGGYMKSPIKFEVVDDRFRDDSGTGRRSLARRPAFEESKLQNKSPEYPSTSSTPAKEEMPHHNAGARSSIPAASVKKVPSAGTLVTTGGNEVKWKVAATETLVIAGDDKKLAGTPPECQKQLETPSADKKNEIMSTSSRKKNTLEELLFELSVPAPTRLENNFEVLGSVIPQSTQPQSEPQVAPTMNQAAPQPATGGLVPEKAEDLQSTPDLSSKPSEGPSTNALDRVTEPSGEMSPSIQQILPPTTPPKDEITLKDQEMLQSEQPLFLMTIEDEPPMHPSENTASVVPETSVADAPQEHEYEHKPTNTPPVQNTSVVESPLQQPVVKQMPASRRTELPADIFTALYQPVHAPMPVWQTGTPHGMGFNMQYYPRVTAPSPAYSAASKSTNPFDTDDGENVTQRPPFPSMMPLQGSLPNAPSASFGFRPDLSQTAPSSNSMQPQPPAYSPYLLNQSPYAAGPSLGMQMEQAGQNKAQHFGAHGFDSSAASSLATHQQATMNYSANGMLNMFPSSGGGNPFG
ncbi:hypothetical protein MLD38_006148 [Melastoma candidum]|uniref:Uncharacterized protein n=1 Tax=Melastoma candidum TaxID=119954 RepID=A0ACB9RMJ1_9MYRT|nr:hypothetical protein MLD38_006148 [Melastoma candidum]